jgi:hypothetical protein
MHCICCSDTETSLHQKVLNTENCTKFQNLNSKCFTLTRILRQLPMKIIIKKWKTINYTIYKIYYKRVTKDTILPPLITTRYVQYLLKQSGTCIIYFPYICTLSFFILLLFNSVFLLTTTFKVFRVRHLRYNFLIRFRPWILILQGMCYKICIGEQNL